MRPTPLHLVLLAGGRGLRAGGGDGEPKQFRRTARGPLYTVSLRTFLDERPDVIVDCINTAGALAYQNAFASARQLRDRAAAGDADATTLISGDDASALVTGCGTCAETASGTSLGVGLCSASA